MLNKRIMVRLNDDTHKELVKIAAKENRTICNLVRCVLMTHIEISKVVDKKRK